MHLSRHSLFYSFQQDACRLVSGVLRHQFASERSGEEGLGEVVCMGGCSSDTLFNFVGEGEKIF
jgi:hypothetical protein